jgi:hypothetical protein
MKKRRLQAFFPRKTIATFIKQQYGLYKKEATDSQNAGNSREGERRNFRQNKRALIVNGILTFFTIVIAGAAVYQGWLIQNEFKIANTPYLQLTKVVDSIHPGQAPMIHYSIENLGKVPCKIIWAELADSVDNQRPSISVFGFPFNRFASSQSQNRTAINRYSIDGSPYEALFTSGYAIDDTAYNDIKNNKSFHHFYGIVGYINQMSGEERIYEFNARLRQSPPSGLDMMTNENWDIWGYEVKHRVLIDK